MGRNNTLPKKLNWMERYRQFISKRKKIKIAYYTRMYNSYNRIATYLDYRIAKSNQKKSLLKSAQILGFGIFGYLLFTEKLRIQIHYGQNNLNEMVKASNLNFNKTAQITEWKEDSIQSSKPLKSKLPNYTEIYTIKSGDDEATIRAKSYIRRFHKLAISEMKKFGVPASIKMAQALLESSSGNSKLALQNNNHFGIKCFSKNCKPGHCTNLHDDHHKDFFRKYDNAWHSWRAHSRLLSSDKYNSLKSLGKDYKKWAKHLKVKGYATDPAYPEKLINLIEKYQLNLLDRSENP